jgi:hydroxymethylbilane synthase
VVTEVITTAGDQAPDRPFAEVGSFGVFVRELETALMAHRIDLAVHSYKDLPSSSPAGLVVAAVPERLDPADVLLIGRSALDLARPMPVREASLVGTASARRRALLRHERPDLTVDLLRGNVPTRINAVTDGRFDAIVLAAAGLLRLDRMPGTLPSLPDLGITRHRLDPEWFVPAPAQGAIAVQVRADDRPVREAVAVIHDDRTNLALRAERAALARAEGGCTLPFGAWCSVGADATLTLVAVIEGAEGKLVRGRAVGRDPEILADQIWRQLSAEVAA